MSMSYPSSFVTSAQQTYISTSAPTFYSATQAPNSLPTSAFSTEAGPATAFTAATTTATPASSRLLPADFAGIAVGAVAFLILLVVLLGTMISCLRQRQNRKQRENALDKWPPGTRFDSADHQEKAGAGFSGVWLDKTPVGFLRGITSFRPGSKVSSIPAHSVTASTSLIPQKPSAPTRAKDRPAERLDKGEKTASNPSRVKDRPAGKGPKLTENFSSKGGVGLALVPSDVNQTRAVSLDSVHSCLSDSNLLPKQNTAQVAVPQKPLPPTPLNPSPCTTFAQFQISPPDTLPNSTSTKMSALKLRSDGPIPGKTQRDLKKQTQSLQKDQKRLKIWKADTDSSTTENKLKNQDRPGPQSSWALVQEDNQVQVVKAGSKPSGPSQTSSKKPAATRFPIKVPGASAATSAPPNAGRPTRKSSLRARSNGPAKTKNGSTHPPTTNTSQAPAEQPVVQAVAHPSLSQNRGPTQKNLSINTSKVREYTESAKQRLPTVEQAQSQSQRSTPSPAPVSRFNLASIGLPSQSSSNSSISTHISKMARAGPSPDLSSAKQASPTAPPMPSAQHPLSANTVTPGSIASSRPSYLPGYYVGDLRSPLATSAPTAFTPPLPSGGGGGADGFIDVRRSPLVACLNRSPGLTMQPQMAAPTTQHQPQELEQSQVFLLGPSNDQTDHRASIMTATTIESYSSDETTPPDEPDGYFCSTQAGSGFGVERADSEAAATAAQDTRQSMSQSAAPSSPLMHTPVSARSPISEIRYPKVPRSSNQAVPRSPRRRQHREHSWASSSNARSAGSPSPKSVNVPSTSPRWPLLSPTSPTASSPRHYLTVLNGHPRTLDHLTALNTYNNRLSMEIPLGASALSPMYTPSSYSPSTPIYGHIQHQHAPAVPAVPAALAAAAAATAGSTATTTTVATSAAAKPQMEHRKRTNQPPGVLDLSLSSDPAISSDALFSAGTGKPLMSPVWQPQLTPRRNTHGDMILDVF